MLEYFYCLWVKSTRHLRLERSCIDLTDLPFISVCTDSMRLAGKIAFTIYGLSLGLVSVWKYHEETLIHYSVY